MAFLRSAWYCVGFPHEFPTGGGADGRGLKTLTVLEEPLVLFRGAAGKMVALLDCCPHRYAPLSKGRLTAGTIECPYHGLRFDASGACVFNPHGNGRIPTAAKAKSYATLERYDLIWVWMGDPAEADETALPDFSAIARRSGWWRREGHMKVDANYQLIADNLLDLTHVPYLHPFLGGGGPPPLRDLQVNVHMELHGETVVAIHEMIGVATSPLHRLTWPDEAVPAHTHLRGNMYWDAPSLLRLDSGAHPIGGVRGEGVSLPSAHLLTPASTGVTHYFWVLGCDRHADDPERLEQAARGFADVLACEDVPMISDVHHRMTTVDLSMLRPVNLPADVPAIRARRMLTARIEAEQARSATSPHGTVEPAARGASAAVPEPS